MVDYRPWESREQNLKRGVHERRLPTPRPIEKPCSAPPHRIPIPLQPCSLAVRSPPLLASPQCTVRRLSSSQEAPLESLVDRSSLSR